MRNLSVSVVYFVLLSIFMGVQSHPNRKYLSSVDEFQQEEPISTFDVNDGLDLEKSVQKREMDIYEEDFNDFLIPVKITRAVRKASVMEPRNPFEGIQLPQHLRQFHNW